MPFSDEIEELLEDLNRLEMASFDADDFDIDGSQVGGYAKDVFGNSRQLHPANAQGIEGGGPLVPNRFVFLGENDEMKN